LREKSAALEALQETGGSHLISLNKTVTAAPEMIPNSLKKRCQQLKYLNSCANKRHQVLAAKDFDLERIVDAALDLQTEIRNLMDERDALNKRIKEIEPWGNFQLPDKAQIGDLIFGFISYRNVY